LSLRVGWRALLGLLLAGAACTGGGRRTPGTLRDDLGAPIALVPPARRIVSLSPSITEILFTIGAGPQVVGRTRWGDYPPAVRAVPSVGDGLDPNVELVVARHPDLVIFYASPANDRAIAQLSALGIATASIELDRLDDLPRAARLLGRLSGAASHADTLADAFGRALDSARAARPAATRPAAVIVWDNPPVVIGAGSFLTELLSLAGARNVFADITQPSAPTSVEALSARDPDLLFVLGPSLPPQLRGAQWQSVGAVRRGHVVPVSGSAFERPSFRAFAAVRALEAAIARAEPGRGGAP
jgi:iron complex transport system substrate-binding protein